MGSLPQDGQVAATEVLRPREAERGPLSYGQQRLWFLNRWLGGRPVYNSPATLRFTGPLNARRLATAVAATAARHDVLFTAIEDGPDGPRQRVFSDRDLAVPLIDLSELGRDDAVARARQLIDEDAKRAFDLGYGLMLRAHIFRLTDDEHWLHLTCHHIAFDGWSLEVFQRQLVEAYRNGGNASEQEPLAVQYADYALWQRDSLGKPSAARALERWSRALGDAPAVLDLGADRPRPAELTYRGRTEHFDLSGVPLDGLTQLAVNENATLYVVLLAAFQALVARHCGGDDIVIGSPTSGRGPSALDELVGYFVDLLVIRTSLAEDPTFRELLPRARAAVLDALSRSKVPFDMAVDHLHPERNLSYSPIVQVAFALHEEEGFGELDEGIAIERAWVATDTAKYDVTWSVFRGEDGLRLEVEYSTDLFDAETVRAFVGHWTMLLRAVVADPDRPLSQIELATPAEAEQIQLWSNQERELPVETTVPELIARHAAETPGAIAVSCDDVALTYAELDQRAANIARRLRGMGVGPERGVGVLMDRSADTVVACLAILKAGGLYVPMDLAFPADRMSFMLEGVDAKVVLTNAPTAHRVPEGAWTVIDVNEPWEAASDADALPLPTVDPENGCYVIYTSGSTGKPKGTMVTHRNVIRLIDAVNERLPLGPQDVWTLFHSFAFDFSVWEMWGALITGGRVVVVPYALSRDAEAFYALVRDQKVTILSQTPSAFRQFESVDARAAKDEESSELSLRAVVFGGAAAHLPSLRSWASRHGYESPLLVNMYGITETTVHTTYLELGAEELGRELSLIGRALPDVSVHVLDAYGRPCPVGVTGEIHVGGDGLSRGYNGQPGLTADRFVPDHVTGQAGARLYRSGDLARWTARGGLEYIGRSDFQVKIRGYRIETGEIESHLTAHPNVTEAVVIARAGADGQADLVGYLIPNGEAPFPDELRSWLTRRIPEYMVPRHFVVMDKFPITSNGKLDRRALPEPQTSRPELAQQYVAPVGEVEETLAAIWGDVLDVDRVGRFDNFFDLGGDSIRAIQVLGAARTAGLAFELQDLFRSPTTAGLATIVSVVVSGSDDDAAAALDREPFSMLSQVDRALLPDGLVDAYPMAELQVGMVYEMELNPERRAYHNLDGLRITGPFDEACFREATARVIACHPILRTGFELSGFSEPMQLVYRSAEMPFIVEDLRHLDEEARDQVLDEYLIADRQRPFDHAKPPLLRFALHRLTDDSFQWTITEHHAIFDGWSLHSTISEIADVYQKLMAGEDPRLTPPVSAYRDFIAAEREMLTNEESRGFWMERVGDRPDCRLPRWPAERSGLVTGGSQPREWREHHPEQGFGSVETLLPDDVCNGLRDLARQCGVPLKAVLLAAHLKVMSLVTGTSDLLVGLTANGRLEEADSADVRGMFLNTVPFRFQMPDGDWRDLVRAAFATERELLPHRRYPLGALQRELGGDPLFEVNFVHNHFHVLDKAFGPGQLRITDDKIDSFTTDRAEPTNFPLNVGVIRNPYSNQLIFGMDYHTDVLLQEQVLLYRDYYVRVFEAMVREPGAQHRWVPILGANERGLLESWNDTAADVPQTLVHRLVEERAAQSPDSVAVVQGDVSLTYGELNARANRLARRLRDRGVGPDVPVALFLGRSPEMITGLLAVMKAGGIYVPVEPSFPADRVEYMLNEVDTPLVLTIAGLSGRVPSGPWQVFAVDDAAVSEGNADNLSDAAGPDHGCYIIFTSGSTGRPKGVVTRHRNVTELVHGAEFLTLTPEDTLLQLAPLSFDNSTFEVWAPLVGGAKLVLAPPVTYGPREIAQWTAESKATVLHATASLFALLVDHEPQTFDGLRRFLTGSETVSPGHVARILERCRRLEVVNCWGPTETTTFSVCGVYRHGEVPAGALPLGNPLVNTQVWVLDEAGMPVPPGTPGELYVSGPCLARGYLGRPGLSAERFTPHPFQSGERLYRTGDRGRWSIDGRIEFLGRTDHMVKVRGYRVELGEVESALRDHPEVREGVVITRENGAAGVDLVAYLVADGQAPSPAQLRAWLGERLPAYMVPRLFVFLDALPLTPRAKVDRRALPELDETRPAVEQEFVSPEGEIEQMLAEIWAQVLGVDRVGRHDDFFDLGGDSIRNIQVVGQGRAKGLVVNLQDLHKHPTVRSLAEAVGSRKAAPPSAPAKTSPFALLSERDRARLALR